MKIKIRVSFIVFVFLIPMQLLGSESLFDRLVSEDHPTIEAARKEIEDLSGRDKKDLAASLIGGLGSEDKHVRYWSVVSLIDLGPHYPESISSLVERLRDESFLVSQHATQALGLYGEKAGSAVPALVSLLNRRQAATQCWVAESLGEIGASAEDAIPALIDFMIDDAPCGHTAGSGVAAAALVKIGPASVPFLKKLVDSKNREVKYSAKWAIKSLRKPAAPAAELKR